ELHVGRGAHVVVGWTTLWHRSQLAARLFLPPLLRLLRAGDHRVKPRYEHMPHAACTGLCRIADYAECGRRAPNQARDYEISFGIIRAKPRTLATDLPL